MAPSLSRRSLATLVTAALLALALPVSALATFPGRNGKIAFVRNGDIWAINADGSGLQQITTNPAPDMSPAWNADGSQIVFTRFRNGNWDVFRYVVNGPEPPVAVTTTVENESWPTWSPDGRTIAFNRPVPNVGGEFYYLVLANADGTNERTIGSGSNPEWAPDGSSIVTDVAGDDWSVISLRRPDGSDDRPFPGTGQVYTEDADYTPTWSPSGNAIAYRRGTWAENRIQFRTTTLGGFSQTLDSSTLGSGRDWIDPTWSPDGRSIAYATSWSGSASSEIRIVDTSGANDRRVTRTDTVSTEPAWQPLKALNPAPSVSSLSPASVPVGSAGITLVVNGSGFVSGSVVRVNGEDRTTTFVSASRLLAEVPAADLDVAGEARVTVFSASPGGGVSASRILTIQGPAAVSPPRALVAPVISGSPKVGELLSCSTGTWSNSPTGFTFAWLRMGVAIPGANAPSHQVVAADAARGLACRVEATNAGGTSSAVSDEVLVAAELPAVAPPVVTPPVIVGTGTPAPRPVTATPTVKKKTGLIGIGAPSAGRRGSPLRFTATFSGVPSGKVVLQRRVKGKFINVSAVRARTTRVTLTFTPQKTGLQVLRVRYSSAGVVRTSRTIVIRVRPPL